VIHALSLIAVGLVVFYAGWLALLWRFQERIVFQPPSGAQASKGLDVPARLVRYRTSDGIDLFAYVVGDCAPPRTVILGFHGNADLSRWLIPWATTAARETNACVVLPEYRGYDGLSGTPTYAGSARDARAAVDYVRTVLGATPANTVYFGHSLGTAVATELAAAEPPRALVLQSPFSSARAMAKRMVVPGLSTLWGMISRVHFDTVDRVRALGCPVWVAHGDKDLVIPVQMGREVYAAAANRGELLIVSGAGHNDVGVIGGSAYWHWLRQAVESNATSPRDRGARAETPPEL
jgi:fermentation-respiration switch protein FrsA (DUF1100 family)